VTRVKICGITSAEDAAAAVEAGADALGFVFVPGTPRLVHPDAAQRIAKDLPPFVKNAVRGRARKFTGGLNKGGEWL